MNDLEYDELDLGGGLRGYVFGAVGLGFCSEVWRGALMSGEFVGLSGVVWCKEAAHIDAEQIAYQDGFERQEAWKLQHRARSICAA